ncbi:MAG: hypothetical protein ABI852_21810, partial [Gemmatimonadaceae bacterium]
MPGAVIATSIGGTATATYLTAGSKTISLTVTDAGGLTNTTTSSVAVLSPPNQAPVVTIAAPTSGSSVVAGSPVTFDGAGVDAEDGALSGASLVWTSNIGGQFATGKSGSISTLAVGTHTLTLTAKDSQGATSSSSVTLTITAANKPPVAAITSPSASVSVVQGTAVTFSGTGTDPEDGALSGTSMLWTSSIAGAIGNGASFSTSTLAIGAHVITLTAKDAQGLSATATVAVDVTAKPPAAPNKSPVAVVTSPAPGISIAQGTPLTLVGSASDAEDGVLSGASLVWRSSVNSQLGTGETVYVPTLSIGTHVITLTAKDSQGATFSRSVVLYVTAAPANHPPVAAITSPMSGSSIVQGAALSLTGSAADPEDGALSGSSLVWTSNLAGIIGTGVSVSNSSLIVGTHVITLTATDSKGATSAVSRTITITANQPPVATIALPNIGASTVQGSAIAFSGTAIDPEDGALSGLSLVWTSSLTGMIGTGASFSTSALSVGTHTITLTATDSRGATNSDSRSVTITANQAPTAV